MNQIQSWTKQDKKNANFAHVFQFPLRKPSGEWQTITSPSPSLSVSFNAGRWHRLFPKGRTTLTRGTGGGGVAELSMYTVEQRDNVEQSFLSKDTKQPPTTSRPFDLATVQWKFRRDNYHTTAFPPPLWVREGHFLTLSLPKVVHHV